MMASKREIEKLESEKRDLGHRLTQLEVDLSRKEESLRTANQRKSELLTDLRQYQQKLKELSSSLEKAEIAELKAKGLSQDKQFALEELETKLRDKTSSFKATVNSLQREIKDLKSRLSEKEDKCDDLEATAQSYKEEVELLQTEKKRAEKELKSSLSNLASALKKSKDACKEQSSLMQELEGKNRELVAELEEFQLEKEVVNKTKRLSFSVPGSPLRCGGSHVTSSIPASLLTPSKVIPEESQIISLQLENKKLKQELSCLQTNFQLTSQKSTQLRSDAKEAQASLCELQAQYENVVQEKIEILSKFEILKSEVQEQKRPRNEGAKELEILKERVEELQTEVELAREEAMKYQKKMKTEGLDAKNKAFIRKLESQVKSLREDKTVLDKEVANIRKELCEVHDQLYESNTIHEGLKRKTSFTIQTLENKVSRLTKEKNETSEEMTRALKQLDQMEDEVQSLEQERKKLESQIQAKDRGMEGLRATHVSRSSSDVEILEVEVRALKRDIEDVKSQNEELTSTNSSLESQLSNLKDSNKKLKLNVSRETKKTEDVARKIIAELELNENKALALETELKAKNKECSNLKAKLELVETRLVAMTNTKDSLEEHISDLKSANTEMEENKRRFEEELKEVEREKKKRHVDKIDSDQKNSDLESKLDAAEFSVLEKESIISDLKSSIEMMEMENAALLAQVTSLSEMVTTRNLKLEAQQTQMNQHDAEVYDIMEKIAQLEVDHGNCGGNIRQLTDQNEQLQSSLQEEVAKKDALRDQVNLLKDEISKLKASLSDLKFSNDELQNLLDNLYQKNDDLIECYSSLQLKSYQLEQDLKSETSTTTASQAELNFEQQRYRDEKCLLEDKIESLNTKLQDSDSECSRLQQQKAILNMQIAELKTEVEELKFSCSNLAKERDGLGEEYKKLKESTLSILHSESFSVPNEDKSLAAEDKEWVKIISEVSDVDSVLSVSRSERTGNDPALDEVENKPPETSSGKVGIPQERPKKHLTRRALQNITCN